MQVYRPKNLFAGHLFFYLNALILLLTAASVWAQSVPGSFTDFEELSLESLLNIKIEVAAKSAQTAAEAPSIVSVITRQEIELYGARDLADILSWIPGFEMGIDVESLIGIGFRGIWFHEGKGLLQINDMPLNDRSYGNTNLIGTIPAEMIERVEVLRGPGSALYGGFAEVSVVHIITKKEWQSDGIRLNGRLGSVDGEAAQALNVGFKSGSDKLRLSGDIGYSSRPLSARTYTDFLGGSMPTGNDNSFRRWRHISLNGQAGNLTVRYFRDAQEFNTQDGYVGIFPRVNDLPSEEGYHYTESAALNYAVKISPRLTVTPMLEYIDGNNIFVPTYPGINSGGAYVNSAMSNRRYRGEMTITYQPGEKGELRIGGGYIRNEVENTLLDGSPGLYGHSAADTVHHRSDESVYAYGQYLHHFGTLRATVGGRYEQTDFGDAFAPRVGLTHARGRWNAKLLYGQAFRIPALWQAYSLYLTYSGDLKPEKTATLEAELGCQISSSLAARLNIFDIAITDPIVYIGSAIAYYNYGEMHSYGFEGELRWQRGGWGGFVNMSYAKPGNETTGDFLSVDKEKFLGLAPLKLNAGAYTRLGDFRLAPTVQLLSKRTAQSQDYATGATNGAWDNTDYDPIALCNLNITWQTPWPDVQLQAAAHNLFAADFKVLQPYYGGHAPMPVWDREISVRLTVQR